MAAIRYVDKYNVVTKVSTGVIYIVWLYESCKDGTAWRWNKCQKEYENRKCRTIPDDEGKSILNSMASKASRPNMNDEDS